MPIRDTETPPFREEKHQKHCKVPNAQSALHCTFFCAMFNF